MRTNRIKSSHKVHLVILFRLSMVESRAHAATHIAVHFARRVGNPNGAGNNRRCAVVAALRLRAKRPRPSARPARGRAAARTQPRDARMGHASASPRVFCPSNEKFPRELGRSTASALPQQFCAPLIIRFQRESVWPCCARTRVRKRGKVLQYAVFCIGLIKLGSHYTRSLRYLIKNSLLLRAS